MTETVNYSREAINTRLMDFCTGKASFKVRIYNGLIEQIITNRKLRGDHVTTRAEGYYTNRIIKPVCTYFLLKSLTDSGFIREYTKIHLLEFLQLSKATFYKHIKELESLNLVKRVGDSLQLASYNKMIEMFDLVIGTKNITYINYTAGSKFHYLVYGSILYNSQKDIKRVIENKIKSNPDLVDHYKTVLSITTNETEFQKALLDKQINDFKTKEPEQLRESFETELINADLQISARKIRKRFGFKSNKSVAFLKAMLQRLKIAQIEKRGVMSALRCRKHYQYVEYSHEAKATIWRLPDAINFASSLYS